MPEERTAVSARDRLHVIYASAEQSNWNEEVSIIEPVRGRVELNGNEQLNRNEGLTSSVYGAHWGVEKIPELRMFSRWANQYPDHPKPDAVLIKQGVEYAKARREVMDILIEMDPEAALASTVPRDVLRQLPQQVRVHLEQRIHGIGTLSVIGVTPTPEAEPPPRLLTREGIINGHTYQAHVFGQMRSFGHTEDIYLHGVVLGDQIALADSPIRKLEAGEPLEPGVPIKANHPVSRSIANHLSDDRVGPFFVEGKDGYSCLCCSDGTEGVLSANGTIVSNQTAAAAIGRAYNNTGAKTWLLIPVAFQDNSQSPWSSTSVRDNRITQTQDFFDTSSYGTFTLPTTAVVPLQTMDNNASYYVTEGYQTLKTHALDKATTAGYNSDNYDFVSIVINHNLYSGWAGRGQVGNKINWIDGYDYSASEQDQLVGTITHELGHNLGLWHANSWESNTSVADDSNGTHDEYGHIFDCMGITSSTYDQEHFNASFKNAMDWLGDSYIRELSDSDTDTTINIYGMDRTKVSGRTYAVKLDTGIALGDNTDLDYWVEFRTRYPANTTLDDGVLIYTSNDAHTDEALKLLDMNPATSSFNDAGLDMGESFTITGGRWKITVNSQSGSGADSYLNVSFEDARAPSITTQPFDASAKYGESLTLTVSAIGPSLSYQWFKDGVSLSGETGSSLSISDFQEDDKGDYHVVVTNIYGSATSNTAALSQKTDGGGGGCGSMPPVHLIFIGWISFLFSRFCLWVKFGEIFIEKKKSSLGFIIGKYVAVLWVCFLAFSGCSSIEARAKGVEKPFPGVRYMTNSRHSVYGDRGVLGAGTTLPAAGTQAECFWVEAGEVLRYTAENGDPESFRVACLLCYWPVDFVATLGLDVLLLVPDSLDRYAQGGTADATSGESDITE